MRIIAGKHKGFRFAPPKKTPARPTTDLAKEGIFNILHNYFDFENCRILDLFSGTGSISYEFASRGCNDITAIEMDKGNIALIQQVTRQLQLPIHIVKQDIFKYIAQPQLPYHLIFADPPYQLPNLHQLPDLILTPQLLLPQAWFVLEHSSQHRFDKHPHFQQSRKYGDTYFSIFELPEQQPTPPNETMHT